MLRKITAIAAVVGSCLVLNGCAKKAPPPEGTVHIHITAHRFAFEPAVIRVKKGQQVELEIRTSDVQHGFEVKDLRIDESIQKGRPTIVTFKPQKTGTFALNCDIVCGKGHDDMEGKIIVE